MKKLLILATCGFVVAVTMFAEDDAVAKARDAAAALLDEVSQQTKALPEDKATKLNELAAIQNPLPTEKEMKSDKGVQVVEKMQKAKEPVVQMGRIEEDDAAKKKVVKILKDNGFDPDKLKSKDCYIGIVDVSLPVKQDPAQDPDFFTKRDIASRMLVLEMKKKICAALGGKFSADESMSIFGSTNMSADACLRLKTESAFTAQWPLFGVTMIAQAESWDGNNYTMAGAAVWSKVLQKAAKAMLCGEENKVEGGESVEEWLKKSDLSVVCGPRQVLDEKCNRVFLGIASRELTGNAIKDKAIKEKAFAAAREHLAFSLFADVEQYLTHNIVAEFSDEEADKIGEGIDQMIAQHVTDKFVACTEMDEFCGTYRHPMMKGKKIYVTVLRTSAEDVANARVMAEELIAIRKATELANKRELGRLQGYKDQIEAAKANTEEFEKGRAEGNAAIERRTAKPNQADGGYGASGAAGARGGAAAAPAKPVEKARQGVYSGEGTIKKNF